MKRKDYDHKYHDFSPISLSSPSPKSRRLDPDLLDLENHQDPGSCSVPEVVLEPFPPQHGLTSSTESIEDFSCDEGKAIVLYNPMINSPLFRSPSVSSDFSVVVNSGLVPGLRERLFSLENSDVVKPFEERPTQEETRPVQDNSRAVVVWTGPAQAGTSAPTEPMEVEEIEMSDADNGGPAGSGVLQQWHQQQQHCMRPELFQATYTPLTW